MTGIQLAAKSKRIRPNIPIIVCTGFSEQINEKESEAMGIQGYVMKPLLKQEIARTVRNLLDAK